MNVRLYNLVSHFLNVSVFLVCLGPVPSLNQGLLQYVSRSWLLSLFVALVQEQNASLQLQQLPADYSTTIYNVSATTTTLTYDYSNEELAML
jgi:hypothetical protein